MEMDLVALLLLLAFLTGWFVAWIQETGYRREQLSALETLLESGKALELRLRLELDLELEKAQELRAQLRSLLESEPVRPE
jgi:hypothetical protein